VSVLLGVLAYGEPFTQDRRIGFSVIWLALLLYWLEDWLRRRKAAASRSAPAEAAPPKPARQGNVKTKIASCLITTAILYFFYWKSPNLEQPIY
jgi:hypothetical protein